MLRSVPPYQEWLIADDDRSMRLALRSLLSRYGVDCREAQDGWEAWEMVRRRRFDAVVTDVDMPRYSGHDLLAKIRGTPDPDVRLLPVLVISSQRTGEMARRSAHLGLTYFLPKPLDTESLGQFVKLCALRRLERSSGPKLQHDN